MAVPVAHDMPLTKTLSNRRASKATINIVTSFGWIVIGVGQFVLLLCGDAATLAVTFHVFGCLQASHPVFLLFSSISVVITFIFSRFSCNLKFKR